MNTDLNIKFRGLFIPGARLPALDPLPTATIRLFQPVTRQAEPVALDLSPLTSHAFSKARRQPEPRRIARPKEREPLGRRGRAGHGAVAAAQQLRNPVDRLLAAADHQ